MNLLIFEIDKKSYAFVLDKVKRVINFSSDIIQIPKSSNWILGLINYENEVIPIVSFREKIGLKGEIHENSSKIVLLSVFDKTIGVVIDSLPKVIFLDDLLIEKPNELIKGTEYLVGVLKRDKDLVFIVDFEKLLTEEDVKEINLNCVYG